MNQSICKNCGAELTEDAWEELSETEDGGVIVDAYPAYVCTNDCGYVERITEFPRVVAQDGEDRLLLLYPNNQGRIFEVREMLLWPSMHIDSLIGRGYWEDYTGNHDIYSLLKNAQDASESVPQQPNIFNYATSELSQDAFLRWLFEHIPMNHHDIPHKIASNLIEKIITKYVQLKSDFSVEAFANYSLKKIQQQVHNIDILLTFESTSASDQKLYIIIEDKVYSGESRKNQPEFYSQKLKLKDSEALIIPVLFKTGYTNTKKQTDYENRQIVFIGYDDIYDVFNAHTDAIKDNVILNSWWLYFIESHYTPVKEALSLKVDPTMDLKSFNQFVRENKFPNEIVFIKMAEYLFEPITSEFSTKLYSVQGQGHVDWHFEIRRDHWASSEKNIALSFYFVWDLYSFTLVMKSSPFKYKPLNKLTKDEKYDYINSRDFIKSEMKKVKRNDWKITNYYLQIAQMKHIEKFNLEKLREKVGEEIKQISSEIDRIMGD